MDDAGNTPVEIGRYRVDGVLGQGAMGRVMLAHDPVLDRAVALKLLRTDLDVSPQTRSGLIARMRNEARAAARVDHPNIVALHDMIEDPELGICLVFERVSGETLKSRIAKGPMLPLEVARVAREVGSALSIAHEAGVLHRDIKPENIMLAPYGAKIADFGIARVPDSTLTRAGGVLGTPAYSAPETISDSNFSPASDQFSLAATLYECVSATRAFPGDSAVTVAAIIATDEPKPISRRLGLDPRVDQVFGRAFSKDPKRRFATCAAFGEALAAALEVGTMVGACGVSGIGMAANGYVPSRLLGRWVSVAVGSVLVCVMVLVIGYSWTRHPLPTPLEIVSSRAAVSQSVPVPAVASSVPVRPRVPSRGQAKTGVVDAGSSRLDAGVGDGAVVDVLVDVGGGELLDAKLDALGVVDVGGE
ncbi:MAG: serine/threonine protein kinase [Polyangiaceae bacterium]|nr:serine/threonine protein kinase [Polyangiaceae bacterium]